MKSTSFCTFYSEKKKTEQIFKKIERKG